MSTKRDKFVYLIMMMMGMISILSLCFAGVVGLMYTKEKEEVIEVISQNEVMQEQVNTLSSADTISQQEVDEMLAQKEEEVKASMKEKMKELVISKEGGPVTMLRYFFPESIIFYDAGNYEFIPVSDTLKKHELMGQNFKILDSGEITYEENGVVTSHKGIDVSKYQEDIDWNAVSEDGVEYAFIRLGIRGYSSGEIVIDDYFEKNMKNANAAGVKTGVYFFTQAINIEEAIEEADFVIENLEGHRVDYPVVYDVEMITNGNGRANSLSKEERTAITMAFCERIKEAGYTPMIYGNIKCFTKMLDMNVLEEYEKWYAFYDSYMYFPYQVSVWQYSDKGTVKGIKGKVDLNISYKTW